MLTSDLAKAQDCPFSAGIKSGAEWCIYTTRGKCKGNNCPCWKPLYVFLPGEIRCPKELALDRGENMDGITTTRECCASRGFLTCADCPDAFGYCGR